MIALWVIIGLIVSALSVSIIGATFSILGLGSLFSGAIIAVWIMASALEFSKFVLAAYLHQRWKTLGFLFKTYLLFSVIVLSTITSIGIFGFLSNAYQSASATFELETAKLDSLTKEQVRIDDEVARIKKAIDEIPNSRITKKLAFRAENAPIMEALVKNAQDVAKKIADTNIAIIEVKQKVGPLIYIAKAFKVDIDTVVKYLILVLVGVFDPLAICLVIATSEALLSRRPESQHHLGAKRPADSFAEKNGILVTPVSMELLSKDVAMMPPSEIVSMRYADDFTAKDQKTG
jgi:hypothetical protein